MTKSKHKISASETKKEANLQEHHCSNSKELKDQIEKKAYALYESRGCICGRDLDDWLEAEKLISGK